MRNLNHYCKQAIHFFYHVNKQFSKNNCASSAADLSFNSLLAIVPLFSISFSILSSFNVLGDIQRRILDYFFKQFLFDAGQEVRNYFEALIVNVQELDVISLTILILSLLLVFSTIERTFNRIWTVESPRSIVQRMLTFWAFLTFGPFLLALGINVSLLLFGEMSTWGPSSLEPLYQATSIIAPIFVMTLIFSVLYLIIPNRVSKIHHALVGGVLVSILIEVARTLFVLNMSYFATYQIIYKAFAVVPLFIIWMYLFWVIVLYGAQVVATLPEWQFLPLKSGKNSVSSVLLSALDVLRVTAENSKGLAFEEILPHVAMSAPQLHRLVQTLQEAGMLELSEKGVWFRVDSLKDTTLYDLYRALGFGLSTLDLQSDGDSGAPRDMKLNDLINSLKEEEQKILSLSLNSFT